MKSMLLALIVASLAYAAPASSSANPSGAVQQCSDGCGSVGCPLVAPKNAEPASLSAADLTAAIEEERVAGDLYRLAADRWQLAVFSHIAAAETRHARAFETLAANAGIRVAPGQPGVYQTAEARSLYAQMVPLMEGSRDGALKAAALLEETNIADLRALAGRAFDEPAKRVLAQLERASERHLRAFAQNLRGTGVDPESQRSCGEKSSAPRQRGRRNAASCSDAAQR